MEIMDSLVAEGVRFRHLARHLRNRPGLDAATARGVLHLLCELFEEECVFSQEKQNVLLGLDARDLAEKLDWREEPAQLVEILKACGYLTPIEAGGFRLDLDTEYPAIRASLDVVSVEWIDNA